MNLNAWTYANWAHSSIKDGCRGSTADLPGLHGAGEGSLADTAGEKGVCWRRHGATVTVASGVKKPNSRPTSNIQVTVPLLLEGKKSTDAISFNLLNYSWLCTPGAFEWFEWLGWKFSIFIFANLNIFNLFRKKGTRSKGTRYIYFDFQKFRFQSKMRNQAWI